MGANVNLNVAGVVKRPVLSLPDGVFERWNMQKSEITLVDSKISQMNGINGHHMVQATASKRPGIGTDVSGKKYLTLRPTGDIQCLKTTMSLAQPYTIFFVFKQLTFVDKYALFSTNDVNSQQGFAQHTTAYCVNLPDASFDVQTGTGYRSGPTTVNKTGKLLILGYVVNTTSSFQVTNGKIMPISNPGSGVITNPSIGYSGTYLDHRGNFDLYDVVLYDRVLTADELRDCYNYLRSTYNEYTLTENYGFGDSIGLGGTGNVRSFMSPSGVAVSDVLFNYSIAGARLQTATYKGVIQQYSEAKPYLDRAKKIFIQVGTNDISAGTFNAQWNTDYRGLVGQMIADGFAPGKIFLTTPPYASSRAASLATLKGYLDQMATDYGIVSVDLIAPTLAGGGDALLIDGVHPTAAGVTIMSDTLMAAQN